MMNKKFANPYIIYYPVISRDGIPFPTNRTVRDIQEEVNKGRRLPDDQLWRGNLVAAKFADDRFTQMMDASMADFPILKNYLGTHPFPGGSGSAGAALPTPPNHPSTTMAASPTMTHPSHPSPHSLHTPLPSPNHPAGLQGPMTRQMQFAEPGPSGATIPQVYDRDASAAHHAHVHAHAPHAHSHGVPMAMMPTPRHDPKTMSAEHHQHHQHQHQHQHPHHPHQHQQQQQQQQQQHHQHQQQHPQMEL